MVLLPYLVLGRSAPGSRVLVLSREEPPVSFQERFLDLRIDVMPPEDARLPGPTTTGSVSDRRHYDLVIAVSADDDEAAHVAESAASLLAPGGTMIVMRRDLRWTIPLLWARFSGNWLAGFPSRQRFVVHPSLDRPRRLFELSPRALFTMLFSTSDQKDLLSILARRQQTIDVLSGSLLGSPLQVALRRAAPASVPDAALGRSIRSVHLSTTGVAIVRAKWSSEDVHIRIPLSSAAAERVANNHAMCTTLHAVWPGFVPRPIAFSGEGIRFAVESTVPGAPIPFEGLTEGRARVYLSSVMVSIRDLHLRFGRRTALLRDDFDRYISARCALLSQRLEGANRHALQRITEAIGAQLLGRQVLITLCHGDLKIENCLFSGAPGRVGIIDWDLATTDDLALVDIASLFGRGLRERRGHSFEDLVFKPDTIPSTFQKLIAEYFRSSGCDPVSPATLMLIYWLDRVYKQFRYNERVSKQWVAENVVPVLTRYSSDSGAGRGKR